MGTKYSTTTVSGYNSSAPSDDGSQTAANQVKWSTIKTKLGDPLNTAIAAVDAKLVTALDFGSRQISSSDTTVAADHMKTVEIAPTVSTSITVSLGDAATMAAGYIVTVKNSSANTQTVGRITAGDKIDGVAANFAIPSKGVMTFKVANTATEGYLVESKSGGFASGETDPTKVVRDEADGLTTATTRVRYNPDFNQWIGYSMGCNGRLTLTTGVPVTTADVTAAETIYFTPHKGRLIWLYDGALWKPYEFTEISGDVPDATQMNDVFIYDNAGTLTADIVAWTNDTTRATALVYQNGVLVKSGATGRRYVGSFYSTIAGNGQTEDSKANRYVWNYYNRVHKGCVRNFTAARSTTSTTYTEINTEIRNGFIIGVSEDAVQFSIAGGLNSSNVSAVMAASIGIDSTTVAQDAHVEVNTTINAYVSTNPAVTLIKNDLAVGLHYATILGRISTGTATFDGSGTAGTRTVLQTMLKG